jgi:hypothetical protein
MTEKYLNILENICFKKENAKLIINNGYTSIESLKKLTEEELIRIGFKNPTERKILIQGLNKYFMKKSESHEKKYKKLVIDLSEEEEEEEEEEEDIEVKKIEVIENIEVKKAENNVTILKEKLKELENEKDEENKLKQLNKEKEKEKLKEEKSKKSIYYNFLNKTEINQSKSIIIIDSGSFSTKFGLGGEKNIETEIFTQIGLQVLFYIIKR